MGHITGALAPDVHAAHVVDGHACSTYRDIAELDDHATRFLRRGRERGERCVMIVPGDPAGAASRLAAQLGDGMVEVLTIDDVYGGPATAATAGVDSAAIMRTWDRLLEQGLDAGATGLCVAAQIEPYVADDLHDAWLRYETAVGRYIAARPMTALCLYRLDDIGDERFAEVACVHDAAPANATVFQLAHVTGDTLRIEGEVDPASEQLLVDTLQRMAVEAGTALTLDASALRFIDHRGLLALDAWAGRCGCTVHLHGHSPTADRLVGLLDLQHLVAGVQRSADGAAPRPTAGTEQPGGGRRG